MPLHEIWRGGFAASPIDAPARPECWAFAMEFLGDPEASVVEAYVTALETEAATQRSRWQTLRDQLQDDIDRPGGRFSVEDDCFAALKWVVERMDEVLGRNTELNAEPTKIEKT